MELLLKYVCGSRLYGTNIATSDLDYLSIHKDSLEDIVLGHSKHTLVNNTNSSSRNTKDDIDDSSKELRKFIKDCLNGQTYAIEAMFLPNESIVHSSEIYNELVANRDRLLSNNVTAFTGYIRGQSIKYSLKGDKLKVLTDIDNMIQAEDGKMTIKEFFDKHPEVSEMKFIKKYVKKLGTSKGTVVPGQNIAENSPSEDYFDIVANSFPGSRKLIEVIPSIKLQINTFGKRVIESMNNGGIDLKAYYHALRIAWELEEYLTTGKITLPCPNRTTLLSIRNGEWDKEYVEEFINDEFQRVLELPNNLPDPDYEYWEQYVLDTYIGRK